MVTQLRWSGRVFWVVAGLSLLLAGCAWKVDGIGGGSAAAADAIWQIKPAAVRIYPSTRLVRQGNQAVLEARIEFVDDVGDPLKAAGDLRLELFPAGRPGEPAPGKPLYTWNASILTRAANQSLYDPVTRTYLLRLTLDPGVTGPGRPPVRLRVLFIPPGTGQPGRLETEAMLGAAGIDTSGGGGSATQPAAPR